LAEAQAAIGNRLALGTIVEAEALARHSGALYGLAEVQRREGIVMRKLRPDDAAVAEAAFRRALETAQSQAARFWELRAARDLASLLIDQGKQREAADLLGLIHAAFTEGFDTPDLIAAKALLDELDR